MVEHARDAIDDRKTQSETRGGIALLGSEPFELLEDDAELALGDAGPGVPHLDREAPAAPAAADHQAAPARIPDGIGDEILQHAPEQRRIGDHHRPRRHHAEVEPALLGNRLEGRADALDDVADDDWTRLRLERAGVELGYVEER